MQDYTLKNPGNDQLMQTLRKNAAAAISNLEGVKDAGGTPGTDLSAFFSDAATKTPGYVAPTLPATQVTLSSGQKVNAVAVTGTGNFATFTIAGGAITGIVLSAS